MKNDNIIRLNKCSPEYLYKVLTTITIRPNPWTTRSIYIGSCDAIIRVRSEPHDYDEDNWCTIDVIYTDHTYLQDCYNKRNDNPLHPYHKFLNDLENLGYFKASDYNRVVLYIPGKDLDLDLKVARELF